MSDGGLHVVFGAGQIGPLVAARLRELGRHVRVVRRSGSPVAVPGVELARGDAMDPTFAAEAARGAEVVYHCINTPYYAKVWEETLPRIQSNLVAAASRAGARLVVLDNLYAYGRTAGRPMDEATPQRPTSRKGEIRARLHDALMDAAARGEVRVAVGRASDFYGPNAGAGSHLGDVFWRGVLAGRRGDLLVNPDQPHTYHFTRDVAAGLVALGLDDGADGLFMLPCEPALTTRQLVDRLGAALGRPISIRRLSPLLLSAAALVVPFLRELKEMAYQWEEPFVVSDAKFRARFGPLSTPLDLAARETVEWARATYR
ncbi:NAD-dependent epimerase/dehydratase family protein [Anaeromyxobacter oryzisoli]|uniref:NAD-dependent epimerase/dehydratase family protein n=1 Tax=Anaeromyxobacter oryzisoli TaxID=2925408 RepID=UPI001F569732|nr:NAD-dependent epimerase/dehydratase family protein [Anaeromyxobacter sp. SG63]